MMLLMVSLFLIGLVNGVDYKTDYILLPEVPSVSSTPLINPTSSPNVSVSVGEQAVLGCRVAHASRNKVSWVKFKGDNGPPELLAVDRFVFSPDNRVKVSVTRHSHDYLLIIQRAGKADKGWYECQLNTDPITTHAIYLNVLVPKSSIEGESEVYVDGGFPHSIVCKIESPSPPHHIFWYFNGQPLVRDEDIKVEDYLYPDLSWSRLDIERVNFKHTGRYECRPSNSNCSWVDLIVITGKPPAELQPQLISKPASSHAEDILPISITVYVLLTLLSLHSL